MSQGNRQYDFELGRRGYMLVRSGPLRGRAWRRSGRPDTASSREAEALHYGNLPNEIEHPEVWNDWSGGFGEAYRRLSRRNAVHWSENMETRFPGGMLHCQQLQLLPARYASVNVNAEFFADVPVPSLSSPPAGAGAVLALGKGYVARFVPTIYQNTAGSAFDHAYEATGGGSITFGKRPAIFGSYTYLPVVNGSAFYQRGHNAEYSQGVLPARAFTVAGGRLWRAHSRYLLQNVGIGANPMGTADWSATLGVGDGHLPVEDLAEIGDQLFLGLADGVYAGDFSGTFVNGLPLRELGIHPDNVRDLTVHNGAIVAPVGPNLYSFYPGRDINLVREIGPSSLGQNQSPVRGQFRCVRSVGKWLLAGLWTGSQSYILAGYDASPPLPFVWHVQQRLPHAARVHRLHLDGITAASGGTAIPQRLWVATDASLVATAPTYFCPVPRGHDNPLADMAFSPNYVGSARVDLGEMDWGAPATRKIFRVLEVEADFLASGAQYADVYYSIDGGPRTFLGRAQESPKTSLYFPVVGDNFVTGHRIALSLESFTASANVSPVYRSLVLRGPTRPNSVDEIQAIVEIGDNVRDRWGGQLRPGAVMLQELRAAARAEGGQLLIDLAGAAQHVVVLPPVEEQEVWQEGQEEPLIAATVRMAVLDFTALPALDGVIDQDLAELTA